MNKKDKTLKKCDELIEKLNNLKKSLNRGNSEPLSAHPKNNESLDQTYTAAQKAAIKEANNLKKNAVNAPWVRHARVPNADKELEKLNKQRQIESAENAMANQLANMMAGKAMLGNVPRQPTNDELFGHLVPKEEVVKAAEDRWNNLHSDWLKEASKPIASKFNSPEEEEQYWASIKIQDKDDGKPGY